MKILFVSRSFSDTKGGMQKVATELYYNLHKFADIKLVAYSGSSRILPSILFHLLICSAINLFKNNIDVIYLQDGTLAPLGLLLRVFKKPIIINVYGLDITYENKLYQFIVPRCVNQSDRVICISNETKRKCISRGISANILEIIPGGVSDEFYLVEDKVVLRHKIEDKIGISLKNKKILLSVGRLVERKGIHWFTQEVITELVKTRNDFKYLIVGEGNYRETIETIIKENNLDNYVHLLREIDDEMLKLLYNASDILVMPNIPVVGDMEGFGLVALEASSCGLPVVASDIEGIKDAVKDSENGFRVKPLDTQSFLETIIDLLNNEGKRKLFRERARRFSLAHNWENIAKKYISCFKETYNTRPK